MSDEDKIIWWLFSCHVQKKNKTIAFFQACLARVPVRKSFSAFWSGRGREQKFDEAGGGFALAPNLPAARMRKSFLCGNARYAGLPSSKINYENLSDSLFLLLLSVSLSPDQFGHFSIMFQKKAYNPQIRNPKTARTSNMPRVWSVMRTQLGSSFFFLSNLVWHCN